VHARSLNVCLHIHGFSRRASGDDDDTDDGGGDDDDDKDHDGDGDNHNSYDGDDYNNDLAWLCRPVQELVHWISDKSLKASVVKPGQIP